MLDEFKIKVYGRTELAQLYLQDHLKASAWKRFKMWLQKNKRCRTILKKTNKQQRRFFNAEEVRQIVDELGEP